MRPHEELPRPSGFSHPPGETVYSQDTEDKTAPLFPAPVKEGNPTADSMGRRLRDNYFNVLPDRTKFTAHDLRRTTSTGMARLGVSPFIVDRVMSHIDQTVRGRHYDRYDYDKEKRDALEKWSRYLENLISEGKDDKNNSMPLFH